MPIQIQLIISLLLRESVVNPINFLTSLCDVFGTRSKRLYIFYHAKHITHSQTRRHENPTTKPDTATLHNLAEDVNHFEQQHGMAPHPLQAQLATHLLWQLDFEQPLVHVLHELTDCMVSLVKLQELSLFPADMHYLVQRLKTLQQLHYFFLECYSSQVLNSQD